MSNNKRKRIPLYRGVFLYFPDALKEVAKVSYAGSKQHHPEKPMHWDRNKSADDLDAMLRHLTESGTIDDDNILHDAKIAWRALSHLQKLIENNPNLKSNVK